MKKHTLLIGIATLAAALFAIGAAKRISDLTTALTLADTNIFETAFPGVTNSSRQLNFGTLATNIANRIGTPIGPSAGGTWMIDDEFIGDTTTRSIGRDAWVTTVTGGGLIGLTTNFTGGLGILHMVVTNAGDRAGFYLTDLANGLTNGDFFFSTRVAVGTLDVAATTSNQWVVGICDSVTVQAGHGIYFLNNSNLWSAYCGRQGVAMIAPLSNSVLNGFVTLAFYVSGNGTNVDFFMGGADGALVWKTNFSTTIPNTPGILMGVQSICRKQVGATERMTNYIDNVRFWAKRL